MNPNQSTYYSAPELAKILQVNVSTVKRWVDKGILPAGKTSGGHRRTSSHQLQQFIAKNKKNAEQSYIIRKLRDKKNTLLTADEYFNKLREEKAGIGQNALEQSFLAGRSIVEILEEVVVPVLKRIGEEWQNGTMTIYEEHRMTFLLRYDLVSLEKLCENSSKKNAPCALLACVSEEQHEIPLTLASIVIKQNGWKTVSLGIHTPAKAIVDAYNSYKCNLIILSKTFSSIDENTYIHEILSSMKDSQSNIILGGPGWKENFKQKKLFKITSLTQLNQYTLSQ